MPDGCPQARHNVLMSDYRRYFVPGAAYFFTLVTQRRARVVASAAARGLLGSVMRQSLLRYPVQVIAIVLLPDRLHTLWTLPEGEYGYSLRWRWIKREFTRRWLALGAHGAGAKLLARGRTPRVRCRGQETGTQQRGLLKGSSGPAP